jgi:hypothetical protein
VFSFAGLALQGAGFWYHENNDSDMTRMLMIGGGVFSAFGVLSLLGALPDSPAGVETGP